MHRLDNLLPIGEAAKLKGVSVDTWRRWEKGGKIQAYRTEGRHRRYKVSELLKIEDPRVSTRDKKDDLQRQISVLEKYCQSRG